MKKIATLAFVALISAPSLAMAMCPYEHDRQANSCPEGQTFDTTLGICVTSATS